MTRAIRVLMLAFVAGLLTLPRLASAQEAAPLVLPLAKILRTGDRVWILPTEGNEISGRVSDVSSSRLIVQLRSGPKEIPLEDLLRVRRRQPDPLWSGVIIGGAVGFVGPFAYCSAASESGETCGENVRDLMITAAIGAAIGLFFDWLVKERKIIYERRESARQVRIAPLPARDAIRVNVSIRRN